MRTMFLGALLIPLLAGCDGGATAPDLASGPRPDEVPTATKPPALQPEQINLKVGDEKALEALIAAHKGEVVFVDYWATWCHPCVEYFPHTVEMSRKYKERGLAVIAVTFDDVEEEAKVRAYLSDQGADFEHVISSYDLGPAAFEGFDIDNVPHFRLYDRDGKLVHKWDEEPVDAEEKIEAALAENEAAKSKG